MPLLPTKLVRPALLIPAGALLRTVQNKYLWLTISLMVYTFGISGGVYDIIRNPAMFTFRQDGTIMWFHPQVRASISSRQCPRHGSPTLLIRLRRRRGLTGSCNWFVRRRGRGWKDVCFVLFRSSSSRVCGFARPLIRITVRRCRSTAVIVKATLLWRVLIDADELCGDGRFNRSSASPL